MQPLANFNMNLLAALDALLAEQSVSRAAERLHVGQPAMSATLRQLRTIFKDPLLVRAGRGLKRSIFADSLQEPLAGILRDVGRLLQSGSAFDPSTSQQSFTIMASDYVELVLLRRFLEHVQTIAPSVGLRVIPIDGSLLQNVRGGHIDLAIFPAEMQLETRALTVESLFADDFVCVADAANPELGDELTLAQLSSLPYLGVLQGLMSSIIDHRLDAAGVSRNTTILTQSFVMAPFMLSGTKMYTILQRRLVTLLTPQADLRVLEPPITLGALHEVMMWSPRRGADPGHAWLREELIRTATSLGMNRPPS